MALAQPASQAASTLSRALPWRLVLSVTAGTLLNPLNSSMIAVALLDLATAFGVDVGTATWLVTSFYIGGAIGMPLMGRLADVYGARRIFCVGLWLVMLSSALAPLAPGFAWLIGLRAIQALGTSAAYPAGLAMFRAYARQARPPAGALGAISIASNISAAFGPVVGGGLVALYGWPAIFLVNVPMAVLGLLLALRWLPEDDVQPATQRGNASSARLLLANPRLISIYLQFGAVNLAFYAVFFGLPLWLEAGRGFAADATGLLLLPVAGIGVAATPLAARLIDRSGPKPSLILGSVFLLAGSLCMLIFNTTTSLLVLVAVGALLGIPNAFNNLGLQAALYHAAPPELMASASGLFQTFRYIGAIAATTVIAVVFSAVAPTDGLHWLAVMMAVVSVGLLLVTVLPDRTSDAMPA